MRGAFLPWPVPRPAGRRALVWLVALSLCAGCAAPRPSVPPRPSIPSIPQEPERDVQRRLLREAQALSRQGKGQAAVALLERWVKTYSGSPVMPEARWWLGQSYEQVGDSGSALAQYRLVAQTGGNDEPVLSARRRLAELELSVTGLPRPAGRPIAVSVPVRQIPQEASLESWIQVLVKAGVTHLVLSAGTEEKPKLSSAQADSAAGVYFKTDWAVTIQDRIGPLVPSAHSRGIAVYVIVNPWRMAWVDQSLGWQASAYEVASGQWTPSPYLDLFHPAFQEYLLGFMADLAGSGVDGVLFRAAPGGEPGERVSRFARGAVEREFGITFDPDSVRPGQKDYAPEVWRWLGWESRQSVKVLDRLAQAARKRYPAIHVGLEIHEEAATDPVAALIRYREDLLEAKRIAWDFFVVAAGRPGASAQGKGQGGAVAKVQSLFGERRPLWVEVNVPTGDPAKLGDRLPTVLERAALPSGVGFWGVIPAGSVP